jgi:hypothetical protein
MQVGEPGSRIVGPGYEDAVLKNVLRREDLCASS